MMRGLTFSTHRTWSILAVVLMTALGLAGCIRDVRDDSSLEGPASWGASERSWIFAAGDPWIVYSHGCGFCGGDRDVPQFRLTALYRDGRVLVVDYSRGTEDEPSPIVERVGLAPYEDLLKSLFNKTRVYAEFRDDLGQDEPVAVLGLTTGTLQRADLLELRPRLTAALQDARTPTGDIEVTDCGPDVVESSGDPKTDRAQVGCGLHDDGWEEAVEVMRDVEEWGLLRGHPTMGGERGSIVPALGHEASIVTRGPILAALHIQTCGGLAYECSGVSGLVLHEDGSIVAFWGVPWKPGTPRLTSCAAYEDSIRNLNATLGSDWAVPCGEEWNMTPPRGGTVPSRAMSAMRDRLRMLDDLGVPPKRQETPCCDRLYTTVHLAANGKQTYFVQEGSFLDGVTLEEGEWSDLYWQLRDLMKWLRPSVQDDMFAVFR